MIRKAKFKKKQGRSQDFKNGVAEFFALPPAKLGGPKNILK